VVAPSNRAPISFGVRVFHMEGIRRRRNVGFVTPLTVRTRAKRVDVGQSSDVSVYWRG
jgi:hypothetical protein